MEIEREEQKEGHQNVEVEAEQKSDNKMEVETEQTQGHHVEVEAEQTQGDHVEVEAEQTQGDHVEVEAEQTQGDHVDVEAETELTPAGRADGREDHLEKGHDFLDFENILLDVRLRKAILYLFKFRHPTKIQKAAIPHILQGRDVIISSKTGSGKTMAYLIPLVQNIIKANINEKESLKFFYKGIILAPTEELCLQIYQVAQTLCSYLKHILSFNHNLNRTLCDHPTVLVTTPRHLYSHTVECKKRSNLDILSNLKILVVDEADILHTKGFLKWMNLLASYHFPKNYSQKYQIVMASATLKESIVEKTKLFLHKPVFLRAELEKNGPPSSRTSSSVDHLDGLHKKGSSTKECGSPPVGSDKQGDPSGPPQMSKPPTNQQFRGKSFYYVYPDETTKYIYLYNLINDKLILHKSIIFTSTIHDAYKIKIFLTYFDIPSSILNPSHPILVRQNVIFAFNNFKLFFLICPQYERNAAGGKCKSGHADHAVDADDTGDAANQDDSGDDLDDDDSPSNLDDSGEDEKDFLYNRGLDFQGVHCVVNFDMPRDTKTFVHRVGRTCRLNNKGISISFINENEPAEKNTLQKIAAKNICTINQKAVAQNKVEMYRYRVESMLNKCTNKKVKHFIQKEILYQSLKSKELKEFFNSNEEEKRAINKIIKCFNTHVVPHKLIKDRSKNLFLKKTKKGVNRNEMNRNGTESGDMRRDRQNQQRNGKSNGREDGKRGAQQHYVKSKSNGFVLTEQAYEDQLRKEPEAEVADPSKLPPIYGKRLRSYVYNKYVMGKRRRAGSARGKRDKSEKANSGRANNARNNSERANRGRSNVRGSHGSSAHKAKPSGDNSAHRGRQEGARQNRRHGSAAPQKA